MKKLVSILLFAAVINVVSCDLDRESPDSIPFEKGFSDMLHIEALERGTYSLLRTAYSLSYVIAPDVQADYVNPVYGASGTFGTLYQWAFNQEDKDVSTLWNDLYGVIAQCNFILDGLADYNQLVFNPGTEDRNTLNLIQGRTCFVRALCYSMLAERFCADYDSATANNDYSGLPLSVHHDPKAKLPRSTLFAVYEQIGKDLEKARSVLLGQLGRPNSTTINIDCVTALQARVYLQMDNYQEALKKANSMIKNSTYSMVNSKEELAQMWTNDKSNETIFQFFASKNELAYTFGSYFYTDYYNGLGPSGMVYLTPDFIPTQDCVDAFDAADWRRQVYFSDCIADNTSPLWAMIKGYSSPASKVTVISKYPGNPELRTSTAWNYHNAYKVFRLAEMYLIAAEAAARDGGDAKTPLNTLRAHRGLPALDAVTLVEVQAERYREMMMEGTRLTDLKRWNGNMIRGKAQTGYIFDENNIGNAWTYIDVTASDLKIDNNNPYRYMFLWPIPAAEIFANKQLETQQNPGWIR